MAEEKRLYHVGLVKIPYEERDVAHAHMPEEDFRDSFAEEAGVGESARYAARLTKEGAEAFRGASNLLYLEEATEIRALGWPEDAGIMAEETPSLGVERMALEWCGFFESVQGGGTGEGVLVGVGDTGYGETAYTRSRLEAFWSFVGDDGRDRHGHGTWCHHAALPLASRLISGKVLGDSGSGSSTDGVAFADKFITYCRSKGVNGILSYSLGGPTFHQAYEDVARRALENGVLPMAAAGNDGRHDRISYPAGAPSWFAVGAASHHDGSIGSFSNRKHPSEPNLYAPGVQILGVGGRWSGTSMATPVGARGAARIISLDGIAGKRCRSVLVRGAAEGERYGGVGRLDVAASMGLAVEIVS